MFLRLKKSSIYFLRSSIVSIFAIVSLKFIRTLNLASYKMISSMEEKSIDRKSEKLGYPMYEEDEIDLYELWVVLKKRFRVILLTLVIFIAGAVAYVFIAPPVYKTEAVIFPIGGEKTNLPSILEGLPVPLPSVADKVTVESVLKSRTLRERVIEKLNLMPVLFKDLWDESRNTWRQDLEPEDIPTILDGAELLEDLISVSSNKKTGTITFSVEFPEDPHMAYKIAQVSLEEAYKILNEKSWSLAKKHRIFLENQIKEVLNKQKVLEEVYLKFIKGEIKEVPIVVDERFISKIFKESLNYENNDKFDIPGNLKQNLERNIPIAKGMNRNLPEYQFNYQKLQWQFEVLKNLLSTLFQQYQIAKANEVKESVSFQIIDPPYIPQKPAKPKKALILAVSFVSGLFTGIFLAFFKEWLNNARKRYSENVEGQENESVS
ncbi:putative protein [Aquifex aeolicus VF5]|uniref:Polysaccharide chain length determinant N-terminal domain-containing protein n=2 Tax=Aquifex aeolicus TaxID=63363 RepID=O66795_AQUAE|nr:putative protein [Aquifex aeolicus VF5]